MFQDKDWIFINIYGFYDWGFEGVKKCGQWDNIKVLFDKGCDWIVQEMKDLGLCGCGGVGFLIGLKWFFMLKVLDGCLVYLVVNVDEFELGICKDCEILCYDLYMLVEGCFIVGFVMGVIVVYIYVCGEFICEWEWLQVVIDQVYDVGLIGKNNKNGYDFDIYVYYGVGVYICGEEIVFLESLEGKKGQLCLKLLFLVNVGFYGCLIIVNNVELIVVVLMILCCGVLWFFGFGCLNNIGIKLFCVFGYVNQLVIFEEEFGVLFFEMIDKYCGGICGGWDNFFVVILGGLFVLCCMVDEIKDVLMDFDMLCGFGLGFGIVVVIVMDKLIDIIKVIVWLSYFYKYESCGQCMLCCEGIGWMWCVMECMVKGESFYEEIDMFFKVIKQVEGYIICVFGDVVVWLIQGLIKNFWLVIEQWIDDYVVKLKFVLIMVVVE